MEKQKNEILLVLYAGFSDYLAKVAGGMTEPTGKTGHTDRANADAGVQADFLRRLRIDVENRTLELCNQCFDPAWERMKAEKNADRKRELSEWVDQMLDIYNDSRDRLDILMMDKLNKDE